MRLTEGLAGLVAEQLRPLVVEDATQHPRFKYFREAGEDPYHSFLGVPLIDRGVLQGVLVVQTVEPRAFSDDDRPHADDGRGAARADRQRGARRSGSSSRPRISGCRRWRTISGGAGTKRRSACSASSTRCCGAKCDHNPIALLQQIPIDAARRARVAAGAAQPHQLRLPPAAGVPALDAHLGRAPRRRALGAAGRVLLRGVRPARVDADLLRRPRHPRRRSRQERVRPRHPARRRSGSTTTRATSASGSTSTAGSTRTTSTSTAGCCRCSRRPTRRRAAHRRRSTRAPGAIPARVWRVQRRPQHAAAARLGRRRQQPRGSRADGAALRRRRARPHPPGAAARRRRRAGADGARHLAGRRSISTKATARSPRWSWCGSG